MGFLGLGAKKNNKWASEAKQDEIAEQITSSEASLGVCIPDHAKSPEDRRKANLKPEISPFDKLRQQKREALQAEVDSVLGMKRESKTNYVSRDLGVDVVQDRQRKVEVNPKHIQEKSKIEFESNDPLDDIMEEGDELDIAAQKMKDGFIPKFSSTARKKFGIDDELANEDGVRETGSFEVTGTYQGAETMISGRVVAGKITKRMSIKIGKNSLRISDLKKSFVAVNALNEGESGTIFTRGMAGNIRAGDVLEFS